MQCNLNCNDSLSLFLFVCLFVCLFVLLFVGTEMNILSEAYTLQALNALLKVRLFVERLYNCYPASISLWTQK